MKDWKGTEVKAGDTVVIVKVRDTVRHEMTMNLMIFEKDGSGSIHGRIVKSAPIKQPPPRRFIWEVAEERRVFVMKVNAGRNYDQEVQCLAYEIDHGTHRTILPLDDPFGGSERWTEHIVCIKGKSDNEQEYYQHLFRT